MEKFVLDGIVYYVTEHGVIVARDEDGNQVIIQVEVVK